MAIPRLLLVTIYTVIGILSIITIVWMAARSASVEIHAMAASLGLCALAAANDWGLHANWMNPASTYLIPYGGLIVFATCLFGVQRRYVGAIKRQEQLASELATRLAERENELRLQHQRVMALERANVLASERQRLVQDMHDGLGSTLTASLMLAEQGRMSVDDMTATLREAVDEMRAVVGSLQDAQHRVEILLGELRFRLTRRFTNAGLNVVWQVEPVPQLTWLEPPDALQLLRWVQEAIANVIKHAQAHTLTVQIAASEKGVRVSVGDDGVGFDTQIPREVLSRGLANLRARADTLSAGFYMRSTPGLGTLVEIDLPLRRLKASNSKQLP